MLKTMNKICLYHHCTETSLASPEITFFKFPKDPERLQKWISRSGVQPHLLGPKGPKFLCEKHFDKIFIVPSQRRKLLLQSGIPYSYDEANIEVQEEVEPEEYDEEDDSIDQHILIEEHDVSNEEETTFFVRSIERSEHQYPVEFSEISFTVDSEVQTESRKRARLMDENQISSSLQHAGESSSHGAPPMKLKKLSNEVPVKLIKVTKAERIEQETSYSAEATVEEFLILAKDKEDVSRLREEILMENEVNQDQLVHSSSSEKNQQDPPARSTPEVEVTVDKSLEKDEEINEFIFKGEEYVQMPKAKYVGEKMVLKKANKTMNKVLRNIKSQILEGHDSTEDNEVPETVEIERKEGDFFEFIFKGEEYVQLPKAKYYSQKQQLQEEGEGVKTILKNIKKQLDFVNLN